MFLYRSTLTVVISFVLCSVATANPNHKNPEAPLAAHGRDTAKALHGEIAALYASAAEETKTQVEAANQGRLARISPKVIAQTRVKLLRVQRLAPHLEVWGEPAGVDYRFRYLDIAYPQYNLACKGWPSLPTSQGMLAKIRNSFGRAAPNRQKALLSLQEMVAEQKWQAAEDELYRVFDEIELGACFLSNQEREQLHAPFRSVQSAIDKEMNRIRNQEANEQLSARRTELTPDFAGLTTELRDAVSAVASTGQTVWRDETLTGPQLVDRISLLWKETHVATLRCRALDWTLAGRAGSHGNTNANTGSTASNQLGAAYESFCQSVSKSLVELVGLDASRTTGDEAVSLYHEYVSKLAALMNHVTTRQATSDLNQALKELASKAPGFHEEVDAYEAGTSELLRWRARAASAMAATRRHEFATLDGRMFEATKAQAGYLGLYPQQQADIQRPQLLASAPKVLRPAVEKLIGSKATAFDTVRVTPTGKAAIARYRARTYANAPAGLDLAAEVDALKADLLVTEEAPPLTLATAVAIHSAERGDLAAMGGEIVGVHLEALITRFATLPAAASVLVPLGELPTEPGTALLAQMMMRFDLESSWAQHDQFFVDFSSPGAD